MTAAMSTRRSLSCRCSPDVQVVEGDGGAGGVMRPGWKSMGTPLSPSSHIAAPTDGE